MDRKLLDLLVCPASHQSLSLLDKPGLDALNRAIDAGTLKRADGSAQSVRLQEALVTRDHKRVYRVDDGIPVLLADEAIATDQADGFPAAPAR
ncbi:Trm112 family protein [Luteimonas abyssi]|uniref:Trm112 family protein n=1 Tax=Luteimonas abyssi TaxID=1247514 RepID=UPI000737CBF7|nr:Trm112 family protein [Luteimonas abyssi]